MPTQDTQDLDRRHAASDALAALDRAGAATAELDALPNRRALRQAGLRVERMRAEGEFYARWDAAGLPGSVVELGGSDAEARGILRQVAGLDGPPAPAERVAHLEAARAAVERVAMHGNAMAARGTDDSVWWSEQGEGVLANVEAIRHLLLAGRLEASELFDGMPSPEQVSEMLASIDAELADLAHLHENVRSWEADYWSDVAREERVREVEQVGAERFESVLDYGSSGHRHDVGGLDL